MGLFPSRKYTKYNRHGKRTKFNFDKIIDELLETGQGAAIAKLIELESDPNRLAYRQMLGDPQHDRMEAQHASMNQVGGSGPLGLSTGADMLKSRLMHWKHGLLVPPTYSSMTGGKI